MVRTFIARDALQAHFVRNLLAREGIVATVLGDQLQLLGGSVPIGAATAPAVWVRAEDEQAAAAVVQRFESPKDRAQAREGETWQCPHCGEKLEPQFTDCWNCGTPRGDQAPPHEQFDPAAAEHVDLDVPCLRCEYNLRGLPPMNRCPECGHPIVPSLLAFMDRLRPEELTLVEQKLRPALERALEGIEYPTEATLFLLSAWPRALGKVRSSIGATTDSDATELCRAVADAAVQETGSVDEALAMLRNCGFTDCRSLGRSLFMLIGHGLLDPTHRVRVNDFSHAPIESLFDRPTL